MQYKTLVACASVVILAGVVACSSESDGPVSPSSSQPGGSEAGPNNETLKATAPVPQSPVNNQQPQGGLNLVATKSSSPVLVVGIRLLVRVRSPPIGQRRGRM